MHDPAQYPPRNGMITQGRAAYAPHARHLGRQPEINFIGRHQFRFESTPLLTVRARAIKSGIPDMTPHREKGDLLAEKLRETEPDCPGGIPA